MLGSPNRERIGEAICRFKSLPSRRRGTLCSRAISFAPGGRHRHSLRGIIGVDNMMWGSDYPRSESTFPQSRKILAEILSGVDDEPNMI